MAAPASNLASRGLRIVGGLIDGVILFIVLLIVYLIVGRNYWPAIFIGVAIDTAYFAYFLSSRGQSIGMMAFGFKVRDLATGQYPTLGKAALRGVIWSLEFKFTFWIIGAIGWLWMLWDPQKQAIHDKVAGTIVTTN
jgi:uncharacterized RDD family membrane protein YckC